MSRGLWFVAGAGAGVYAAVRARRAAEILTVDGLRDRVGAAVVGARMFRDEVAQGRADSEGPLRQRLGAALQSVPELEHRPAAAPGDAPAGPPAAHLHRPSTDQTGTDQTGTDQTSTDQEGPT